MAKDRRKAPRWTEEVARNVVRDHASGRTIEEIAKIYRVPQSAVLHYLESYGLLYRNAGSFRQEEPVVQAKILQSLAEGKNPYTGERLPPEILGRPEILRALSAGAAALMEKQRPVRASKPWKAAEEERLRDLKAAGKSNAEAARRLRRTERAIEDKLDELTQRPTEEEKRAAMRRVKLRASQEDSVWSQEELRKLRDMSASGMDVLNIAAYFGKSVEETDRAMNKLAENVEKEKRP